MRASLFLSLGKQWQPAYDFGLTGGGMSQVAEREAACGRPRAGGAVQSKVAWGRVVCLRWVPGSHSNDAQHFFKRYWTDGVHILSQQPSVAVMVAAIRNAIDVTTSDSWPWTLDLGPWAGIAVT